MTIFMNPDWTSAKDSAYLKKYIHGSHFVVFCSGLAGQAYVCHRPSKVTLPDMDKHDQYQQARHKNES